MAANYSSVNKNTPYGSGDPYYNSSTGYVAPAQPQKKQISNWIKFGVPIAVLVIAGAILGGVFGSRANKNSQNALAGSAATSAVQAKNAIGIFPTGTDSLYMLPLYPATVCIPHIFPRVIDYSSRLQTDQYRCLHCTHIHFHFGCCPFLAARPVPTIQP